MRCFSWLCKTCITYMGSSKLSFQGFPSDGFWRVSSVLLTSFSSSSKPSSLYSFLTFNIKKVDRKGYVPDSYFPKHMHPLNRQNVLTSPEKQALHRNSIWNEQAELQPEREVSFLKGRMLCCQQVGEFIYIYIYVYIKKVYIYIYMTFQFDARLIELLHWAKTITSLKHVPLCGETSFLLRQWSRSIWIHHESPKDRHHRINRHHRNRPPEWYHYDIVRRL